MGFLFTPTTMKKLFLTAVVAFAICFGAMGQGKKGPAVFNLPADSVVSIVYSVLEEFSKESGVDYPVFKEASLSLESSVKYSGGAGFEIPLIAEGGAEVSKGATSKATFGIKPQKTDEEVIAEIYLNSDKGTKAMTENSKEYQRATAAVTEARAGRRKKRERVMTVVDRDGMVKFLSETNKAFIKSQEKKNVAYKLEGFDVEFNFTMSITAEGKIKFTILGFGGSFGGDFEKTFVHTIAISYTAKEKVVESPFANMWKP